MDSFSPGWPPLLPGRVDLVFLTTQERPELVFYSGSCLASFGKHCFFLLKSSICRHFSFNDLFGSIGFLGALQIDRWRIFSFDCFWEFYVIFLASEELLPFLYLKLTFEILPVLGTWSSWLLALDSKWLPIHLE